MSEATQGFAITAGALSARWPASGGSLELIALECATGLGGGWAKLRLGPPQGEAPELGAPLTIDLDDGRGAQRVFTGELDHVGGDAISWRLRAHDGLPKLARLDLEKVWSDTTADAVVKDLLAAAGLKVGTVCAGPALRVFAALKGPRGLRLVEGLLARMGAELLIDAKGTAVVEAPKTGSADHTLTWGVDLLGLELSRCPPVLPGVEVWGEGAGDAQGASKAHWLPKDASGLVGRSAIDDAGKVVAGKVGQPGLTLVDGALGAAKACKDVATARARLLAARPLRGWLTTLGRPSLHPGELVEIKDVPAEHSLTGVLAGPPLRARRVIHHFDAKAGFVTRVEV